MPKYVKVCTSMHKYEKGYKSMPKYLKLCQSIKKYDIILKRRTMQKSEKERKGVKKCAEVFKSLQTIQNLAYGRL